MFAPARLHNFKEKAVRCRSDAVVVGLADFVPAACQDAARQKLLEEFTEIVQTSIAPFERIHASCGMLSMLDEPEQRTFAMKILKSRRTEWSSTCSIRCVVWRAPARTP